MMDGDVLSTIGTLLEFGWPAIVLVFLFILWGEYKRVNREYIEALREVAGLKASLQRSQHQPALASGSSKTRDTSELHKP